MDCNAKRFEVFCHIALFDIRAGNPTAAVLQYFCQTGHADSADADKINMGIGLYFVFHSGIASIFWIFGTLFEYHYSIWTRGRQEPTAPYFLCFLYFIQKPEGINLKTAPDFTERKKPPFRTARFRCFLCGFPFWGLFILLFSFAAFLSCRNYTAGKESKTAFRRCTARAVPERRTAGY